MLEALLTMKMEFRDLRLCDWLAAYAIYQLEHFTDETAWFGWIDHIRTGMTRCKKETNICSWPGTVTWLTRQNQVAEPGPRKRRRKRKKEPNLTDPAQPDRRKRKKRGREGPKPTSSWADGCVGEEKRPIEQLVGPNGLD